MPICNLYVDMCDWVGGGLTSYVNLVADGIASGTYGSFAEVLSLQPLFELVMFENMYVVPDLFFWGQSDGTVTYYLRKNQTNTALTVSIPPGGSGAFRDQVDTVSAGNGDKMSYSVYNSGTQDYSFGGTSVLMVSPHYTSWMNGCILKSGIGGGALSAGVTAFGMAGGAGDYSTTETNAEFTVRFSLHSFGMYVYVTNNSTDGATTFRMRKNVADGNQTVSVSAGGTGSFTDSVDTDDFASGDSVDYSYINAGSTGSLDSVCCTVTCYSTSGNYFFAGLAGETPGMSKRTSPNGYYGYSSDGTDTGTNDLAARRNEMRGPWINALFFALRIISGGSAVQAYSQINDDTGSLKIAIPASTTGFFEDQVDVDSIPSGATYNTVSPYAAGTFTITPTVTLQERFKIYLFKTGA